MKRRYSVILSILTLLLCLVIAASAYADTTTMSLKVGDPNLTVAGEKLEIDPGRGTKPVIVNGRTLVPIRAIIEAMGGTVDWNAAEQKVTVKLLDKAVELWIGKTSATVSGVQKPLDVGPKLINGRTMMPARFILESLGATVDWDEKTQSVMVKYERASDSAYLRTALSAYLKSGRAPTISAEEVYNKIVVGKDPSYQIVSVRKTEDYAKGHIAGAINIPYGEFYKKENLAKLDKSKKIVVVCYTGHTASQITVFLNQLGYEAYAMKFGMMGWTSDEKVLNQKPFTKAADYPVETTINQATATYNLPSIAANKNALNDIIIAQAEKYLKSGRAPTISVEDVYNKIVVGKDPGYFLVSIRKAEDYAKGHVPGAINIPYGEIAKEENLKKLPPDKKIVVICYTGHTASQVTMFLNQLGYEAYAMKFGMMGWTSDEKILNQKPFTKAADYPVVASTDTAKIIEAADKYLATGRGPTVNPEDIYNKVVVGGDTSYFLVSLQKPEDYAKGHVKGAINIPFAQIAKKENLAKLPKDKKIVLICYTGHTASYAAMFLNQLGYEAYAMKFGTMGWNDTTAGMGAVKPYTKSAGYPTDTTAAEAQANNQLPVVASGFDTADDIIIAATDKYLSSGRGATVNPEDIFNKVVVGGDSSYFLLSIQKAEDYAKGHVKGAINIPYAQIAKEENLKKLPKDKKIVVICYTGHTASYTAMLLNQLGYEAYAMKFGTMGWNDASEGMGSVKPYTKSAGYPVVEGSNP